MSSWNYGGSSSSNPIDDEPVIPKIVEKFTSDDFYEDNTNDQEIVLIPTMDYNSYGEVELQEHMQFDSKEATVCHQTLSHHQWIQLQCGRIETPSLRCTMHPLQQWMSMTSEG